MKKAHLLFDKAMTSALYCLFAVYYSASAQQPIWVAPLNGAGNDNCNAIHVDGSGNVYSTGFLDDSMDFDPGVNELLLAPVGATDIFLQKLDPNGNLIWARNFGSTSLSADEGFAVTSDANGNVYVTGSFYGSGDFNPGVDTTWLSAVGTRDIFVIKFDSGGNFIWAKSMGGSQADQGSDILIDNSGSIWISGSFSNTVDFNPGSGIYNLTSAGSQDAYLLKLDLNGNFLWAGKYGSSGFDEGKAIDTDVSGNLYLHGTFSGTVDFDPGTGTFPLASQGGWESCLVKYSPSGTLIWAKSFGGTSDEYGFALNVSPNNFVYAGGRFKLSVDFDPGAGNSTFTAAGSYDGYVVKFDTSGNFVWANTMSGPLYEMVYEIEVDPSNESVYAYGVFDGTADFGTGIPNDTLVSFGNTDLFLAQYSLNGSLLWAGQSGSPQSDYPGGMQLQSSSVLYLNGYYSGTADLDPGTGIWNLTAQNSYDPFVEKLDVTTLTALNSPVIEALVNIYPNPAQSNITIEYPATNYFNATITDLTGKALLTIPLSEKQQAFIDISHLKAGMYLIKLSGKNNYTLRKLIITDK